MKSPEYYRGREQTALKHYFLEQYLERVAYNIFSFEREFVFVDGFSGPWRSKSEAHEDTSFVRALNELRKVRDGLRDAGKDVEVRCLFVEKNPTAFAELERSVDSVTDIQTKPLLGAFEDLIPEILDFVGRSFSLVFVDPTGWTGIGLREIAPILRRRRGEVLLNFMFDPINRFLNDPRPEIAKSFDSIFGGPNWNLDVESLVDSGFKREDAILRIYQDRFRLVGEFSYVTNTRILMPLAERSYFHLVYGTRHWKGLVEFREVERKTMSEQERVRSDAIQTSRERRSGQSELFDSLDVPFVTRSLDEQRSEQLEGSQAQLGQLLIESGSIKYEVILGTLLENPLVWKSDIDNWLREMRSTGEIEIKDMSGRERTPKPGYVVAVM